MTTGRSPAICGAAQIIQRPGDVEDLLDSRGPIELMLDAARGAAEDAGAPGLLGRIGWIGVAGGFWRYSNPGQVIASRLGSPAAATALSAISGSSPQDLVGLAADRIAGGQVEVALVLGGEARWTTRRLQADGLAPRWIEDSGEGQPEAASPFPAELFEEVRDLGAPATAYALFDDSRRRAAGESVEDHRSRIAQLWESFSAVAAANPYAWDRTAHSAAEIREPTAENRMIAFPYTKAMVANNTVDMASAVLLCSLELAREFRIADDRLVFPQAVTTSHETWKVIHRDVLHEAPALAAAGRAALDLAGVGAGAIEHIDLYACFPAIVQMSVSALGLDGDRPLTLTGGLGFAGAPIANSSGQAIAALVPRVRAGGVGFVHANGGNATKHAFGVYAGSPPAKGFRLRAVDDVDRRPRPELEPEWSGPVEVEAATVLFDRGGPSHAHAAVLDARGHRGWVQSRETDIITAVMTEGIAGRSGQREADGSLRL